MSKNILIFRTDRIGDLIYSCPTIITLKKYIKDSKITLVASNKNYDYAKSLDIFDEIYIFPKNNILNKIKLILFLAKKKFQHILILDGKDRSLISSLFIKSENKVLVSKVKFIKLLKFFKIKNVLINNKDNFLTLFNLTLKLCNVNKDVENFNFLKNKKKNNFSKNISIKNYVHIHLDEKWTNDLYINEYTKINLKSIEFINFIEEIVTKKNILITTGLIDYDILHELMKNYFNKKSKNIFKKEFVNNSIYFIYKPSFYDLESLLENTKVFVSCHCAVTHAANSFGVKVVDIIDEKRKNWYSMWTSHFENYKPINRDNFSKMKPFIVNEIINN